MKAGPSGGVSLRGHIQMSKAKQEVLIVFTDGRSLRSPIEGWTLEDPRLYVKNKPIGMTPSPKYIFYTTVLEALADGWVLLAPPFPAAEPNPDPLRYHDWWLVRDVSE
jgi:hypothetical protein